MADTVKHIYVEKEFVLYIKNTLGHAHIDDTLSFLKDTSQVFVSKVYLAWKNNDSNILQLLAAHKKPLQHQEVKLAAPRYDNMKAPACINIRHSNVVENCPHTSIVLVKSAIFFAT